MLRYIVLALLVAVAVAPGLGGNNRQILGEELKAFKVSNAYNHVINVVRADYKIRYGFSLEEPLDIYEQVVAGFNYTLFFDVPGQKNYYVTVFCQDWTKTYEIIESGYE